MNISYQKTPKLLSSFRNTVFFFISGTFTATVLGPNGRLPVNVDSEQNIATVTFTPLKEGETNSPANYFYHILVRWFSGLSTRVRLFNAEIGFLFCKHLYSPK